MRRDQPPFLLSSPGRCDSVASTHEQTVTALGEFDTAVTEIAVHGRWDPGLKTITAAVLRTCLVSWPAGIIADLHDLADPAGASAALWSAARLWGAQTPPPIPVVVCLPAAAPLATALTRNRASRDLPVYPTMPEARAALTSSTARPDRLILHLDPSPDIDTQPQVTDTLANACHEMRLASLHHRARLVLTELVANALEHARTRVDVAVTPRRNGLHLAVRDRDRRFPHLAPLAPGKTGEPDRRGYGLRLVHTATTAWGALPTRDGKIVWAVLGTAEADPLRPGPPHRKPCPTRSPDRHG
jgi:hypothetical protein